MLPKQVVSYQRLLREGFKKRDILSMVASLKLFPTPFKGIYYVPLEEERKAWFIEKPLKVLSMAIGLFLNENFYYSCSTAEEALGIRWVPSNEIHVVNKTFSGRINLKERIERNAGNGTYRSKKIARLLSFYGNKIIFHKTNSKHAKVKQTPYGRFALRAQIKIDRKKFREKA